MKTAFLGIGIMGNLMVERLLEKKLDVIIWNRTLSKTENLKSKGADVALKPGEAIDKAGLIITMLSDFSAVSQSLFSEKINFKGKTVIQMSTIAPGESCIIQDRIENSGGEYLEAPVLGGVAQIPHGKLIPMVGGRKNLFDKWKPFLLNLAEEVHYMGEVGKGAAAKLACNQLIATMVSSFSMSLGYIESQGIDVETFMKIIRPSAYYAPAYDKKLESMVTRNFDNTNFALKNLLKDVNLAKKEFSQNGIETSILDMVANILKTGVGQKLSELDYSAMHNVIYPPEK